MESDRYGLALATSSTRAAAAYRRGVDLLLAAWPGAERSFLEAIAEDPGFALAHAALARHLQIYARMAEARETAARERARRARLCPFLRRGARARRRRPIRRSLAAWIRRRRDAPCPHQLASGAVAPGPGRHHGRGGDLQGRPASGGQPLTAHQRD